MTADLRLASAALLAASIAVLAAAYAFQYLGGLEPCVLCVWQRYPYGVTIALAALALILAGRRAAAWSLALCGLAFLAGAAIAGFHVGVEQHWWQGTAACTGALDIGVGTEALTKALVETPVARCDQVPWSLFGISMAGYNLMLSLLLAAASIWAAWWGLAGPRAKAP